MGEGLLSQTLAIVKCACHFQRGDVFTERGELLLLRLADALRRIENYHADSRHAQETVRHGSSSVPGCGHQHFQRPHFATNKISHQPRPETSAAIFDYTSRPKIHRHTR